MELALLVWLVMTVIPAINGIGVFATVTSAIVGTITAFCWVLMSERERKESTAGFLGAKTYLKWALPIALIAALVPDKETSWYIIGAYAAQTVATSEFAGEVAGEGKELLLELIQKARAEVGKIDLPVKVEKVK